MSLEEFVKRIFCSNEGYIGLNPESYYYFCRITNDLFFSINREFCERLKPTPNGRAYFNLNIQPPHTFTKTCPFGLAMDEYTST